MVFSKMLEFYSRMGSNFWAGLGGALGVTGSENGEARPEGSAGARALGTAYEGSSPTGSGNFSYQLSGIG